MSASATQGGHNKDYVTTSLVWTHLNLALTGGDFTLIVRWQRNYLFAQNQLFANNSGKP